MHLLSCPSESTLAIFRPINGVRRSRPLTARSCGVCPYHNSRRFAYEFFSFGFRSKLRCITNRSSRFRLRLATMAIFSVNPAVLEQ